jgi:hypothetical protein
MNRIISISFLALTLALSAGAAGAQSRKKQPSRQVDATPKVISEDSAPAAAPGSGEVLQAADIYKTSLKQLIEAREAEATRVAKQLDNLKALFKDGLISKRELDTVELSLLEARHKVDETRRQLAATDATVVESLAEKDPGSVAEFDTAAWKGSGVKKVAYIRNKGYANWSVSEIGKVEKFFSTKFRRPLPVAAMGQSDLHSRWGFDHRNAVDVGVHPDTAEGLALMNYLSGQGIPFMAFRRAVPGSATGPHIHIGKPSQKESRK